VRARDLSGGRCAVRSNYASGLSCLTGGQVTAALTAHRGVGGVARAAIATVDVRTGLGAGDLGLVSDQGFLRGLMELNILGLGSATTGAFLARTTVAGLALRADPL